MSATENEHLLAFSWRAKTYCTEIVTGTRVEMKRLKADFYHSVIILKSVG